MSFSNVLFQGRSSWFISLVAADCLSWVPVSLCFPGFSQWETLMGKYVQGGELGQVAQGRGEEGLGVEQR